MKYILTIFFALTVGAACSQTYILPSTAIPATICKNRFGAKATYTLQTDTRAQTSIWAAILYGFKNNVRLGAFTSSVIDNYTFGLKELETNGISRHDIYFAVDYWANPTTGAIELIPDYAASTWTSAGVAAFPETAVLGQAKSVRYPNHGQQMYTATNGRLGYNLTTSTYGTSHLSELNLFCQNEVNWMNGLVGRIPSSASYRFGRDECGIPSIPFWLAGRNDRPLPPVTTGTGNVYYGSDTMTRSYWASFPSTDRNWDAIYTYGLTQGGADSFSHRSVDSAIASSGWYRNFMHFNGARANGTITFIDTFLQKSRSWFGSNFVWTCSIGEAIEYMYVRQLCKGAYAAANSDSSISVIALVEDRFKGQFQNGISTNTNLDALNVPLSVQVDLTGTVLAGQNVVSSYGKIRSLGSNKYIVQVPFSKKEGFSSVRLSKGSNGYFVETRPTGTKNISGTTLTVTTDLPTRAVLFQVATGGAEYDYLPVIYDNNLSTVHTFTITTGKDYKVGITSEFLQSNIVQ